MPTSTVAAANLDKKIESLQILPPANSLVNMIAVVQDVL
jgi:hypothetical protein